MEDTLDLRPELELIRAALVALQTKLMDIDQRGARRPKRRLSGENKPASGRRLN